MELTSSQIVPFIDKSNRRVGFQHMNSSARMRAANSFSELIAVTGEHLADHGWECMWQRFSGITRAMKT